MGRAAAKPPKLPKIGQRGKPSGGNPKKSREAEGRRSRCRRATTSTILPPPALRALRAARALAATTSRTGGTPPRRVRAGRSSRNHRRLRHRPRRGHLRRERAGGSRRLGGGPPAEQKLPLHPRPPLAAPCGDRDGGSEVGADTEAACIVRSILPDRAFAESDLLVHTHTV